MCMLLTVNLLSERSSHNTETWLLSALPVLWSFLLVPEARLPPPEVIGLDADDSQSYWWLNPYV